MAHSSTTSSSSDMKPLRDSTLDEDLYPPRIRYDYPQLSESWPFHETTVTLNGILAQRKCIEQMRWAFAKTLSPRLASYGLINFLGGKKTRYIIPDSIPCDRLFLREPCDCVYVEAAARYLRGLTVNLPILQDDIWSYPDVAALQDRSMARNWAVGAAEASLFHGRIISPSDWASFNLDSIRGRFKLPIHPGNDSMLVPDALFPEIPERLKKTMPTPHLAVETPRMGYYFGWIVSKLRNKYVKERYEEMYTKEYCVNFVISFLGEMERGRVWDIRKEFNTLLRDVIRSLPDMPRQGKDQSGSILGDFSRIRNLMDPWTTCQHFVTLTAPKFEMRDGVYVSKRLVQFGTRDFLSSENIQNIVPCANVPILIDEDTSLMDGNNEDDERTTKLNIRQTYNENEDDEITDQKQKMEASSSTSTHDNKRLRSGAPVEQSEMERGNRHRLLPYRTCKKTKEQ